MKRQFQFKSIKQKMLVSFGILILFVLGTGILSYHAIHKMNQNVESVVDKQLPLLLLDKELTYNMTEITSLMRGYFLFDDDEIKKQLKESLATGDKIEQEILDYKGASQFDGLIKTRRTWDNRIKNTLEIYESGDKAYAQQMLVNIKPLTKQIQGGIKKLSDTKNEDINLLGKSVILTGKKTIMMTTIISVVVLVLSIVIAVMTSNSIKKPITTIMNRMKRMADGDIGLKPLVTNRRDEVAQLIHTTNKMGQENLQLLNRIRQIAQSLSTQSEELNQTAGGVNQGTEQMERTMQELSAGSVTQANSTTSLSQMMHMFSAKVKEANVNGEQIKDNSNNVLKLTKRGGQFMQSSTDQMERIYAIVREATDKMTNLDKQAKGITKLVSVIKDVADQTNLLALNAAIEAARAGEHGKGFAVVADEVKKLAEQVSLSVNEIHGFVTNIQKESNVVVDSLRKGYEEVNAGTKQIELTNETFTEITTAVTGMAENIRVVSENLTELMTTNDEMNQSIEEIAGVSEESAAGVGQTATSAQLVSKSMDEVVGNSEKLAEFAVVLNKLVEKYTL